jgi:selT/selW/selH-like putative selenoprotein
VNGVDSADSGAYEITINGVEVFSKLETGKFPKTSAVIEATFFNLFI